MHSSKERRRLQSVNDKARAAEWAVPPPFPLKEHRTFLRTLKEVDPTVEDPMRISPKLIDFAATLLAVMLSDAPLTAFDLAVETSSELHTQRAAFMRRLIKRTQLSCSSFIVGLMYLARLKERHASVALPNDPLRPGCAEAAVAFMTADKYLYDTPLTNAVWAECCGQSLHEFNQMEANFLARMNYSLFFTEQDYESFVSFLEVGLVLERVSLSFPLNYGDMCILTQDAPDKLVDLLDASLQPLQAFLLIFKFALAGCVAYIASFSAFYYACQAVALLQGELLASTLLASGLPYSTALIALPLAA